MVRFEDAPDSISLNPNLVAITTAIRSIFGTDSTVHAYHSAIHNSRALMPHTDPYDVIVLQLEGRKTWTTCIPEVYSDTENQNIHVQAIAENITDTYTPAQLAQLQEIRRQRQQGCTSYSDEDLRGMKCRTFTLEKGDALYMPKGMIHFAISEDGGSTHLTLSLKRQGLAWADAILFASANTPEVDRQPEIEYAWEQAVRYILNHDAGVEYLETIPSWQLSSSLLCDSVHTDEQLSFAEMYQKMCLNLHPFVKTEMARINPVDAVLRSKEIEMMLNRVCDRQSIGTVLVELCRSGRLPIDSTSPAFRQVSSSTAQNEVRNINYCVKYFQI